jgi:hypothetical protein
VATFWWTRYQAVRTWFDQQLDDPHRREVLGPEQRVLEADELERLRDQIRARLPATAQPSRKADPA